MGVKVASMYGKATNQNDRISRFVTWGSIRNLITVSSESDQSRTRLRFVIIVVHN